MQEANDGSSIWVRDISRPTFTHEKEFLINISSQLKSLENSEIKTFAGPIFALWHTGGEGGQQHLGAGHHSSYLDTKYFLMTNLSQLVNYFKMLPAVFSPSGMQKADDDIGTSLVLPDNTEHFHMLIKLQDDLIEFRNVEIQVFARPGLAFWQAEG